MGSRGGSNGGGGGVQGIPAACRKMVQSLKEIVNGVPEAEIYSTLKDCNMDPNEAVNRLLSQDPFHEVKSKREKKKEFKDTTESRPRGGSSSLNRGARSGTERYAGRGISSQFSSSEPTGSHGRVNKRENGTSSYTSSYVPASGMTSSNTNRRPSSYSDSLGVENQTFTVSAANGTPSVSQPSSGFQSAWIGVPGQKSMADIVKMGRPQNKTYSTSNPSQQSINHNLVPHELHSSSEYAAASADPHVSSEDQWPSIEQPQPVGLHSVIEPHTDSELNPAPSNLQYERSNQYFGSNTDEAYAEDETAFEDHVSNHVQEDASGSGPLYDNELYHNMGSYHAQDHAFDQNEVEEGDASVSSVTANMQQLDIQEEARAEQPEEDVPSVVIPDHLQVQTADCSHLSFGSFGASMNTGFSAPFASRTLRSNIEEVPAEADTSSAGHSETRNPEYYGDEPIRTSESNLVHRTGVSAGSYDLPSVSQTEVLKQENSEATHGNQYNFPSSTPGYTFDNAQLLNTSFPQSQTPAQMQNTTSFSNMTQPAYSNSLPSALLAANGHPVRESELSYSPFPISQSMPTKYGTSVSSITGSTISMAEALKTVGFSSAQTTQQTPSGNTVPPTLQQHLAVHPYSQPTLPLGPFANMIGYPFLPQSYTYMPSGFQQAFAGNSTYHQQLAAAVLPQYKNSVSVSSLPQSAAVASGYGSFGNSTTIPGNYQVNQPAGPTGSTLSYDDVLSAHYKDSNQLLSLQQNDNSAMWIHGAGSRTMSAVPASTYYGFQGQNQQASGFRQGQQQPSQSYGGAALNYPNFYHSQSGITQEHQLQQNPRDGSLVGGSQGQPKQQSQQLWQNGY